MTGFPRWRAGGGNFDPGFYLNLQDRILVIDDQGRLQHVGDDFKFLGVILGCVRQREVARIRAAPGTPVGVAPVVRG